MIASAVAALRHATASDHAMVDARFGAFDLARWDDYGEFMIAHARVLPGIETALAGVVELPPLRRRADLIAADLAALGLTMPTPWPWPVPCDTAEAYGAAYVIEGSRLGGTVMARSLAGRPAAYLSASHLAGEWRGFLGRLEAAAIDETWLATAARTARAVFARYAEAADCPRDTTTRSS